MVRELVMVSAFIGGVAVAAPMIFSAFVEAESGAGVRAGQGKSSAAAGGRKVTRSWNSRRASAFEVEIKAATNGHFYIETEMNRAHVPVMVDTGASIVALRASDAAAAGIRPHRDDFTVPLNTANGTSYGAAANIDSIVVDMIEVRDVQAVVIPDDQLTISLLGTSFLSRLNRFQVSGNTLIIED